jgi:hypothetical protein
MEPSRGLTKRPVQKCQLHDDHLWQIPETPCIPIKFSTPFEEKYNV